ncbi:MAG: cytochrome c3 family protein, partial [FCB group bacterium]
MRKKIFAITILTILISGLCIILAKPKSIKASEDQCYNCHTSLDGKNLAPAKAYTQDIHFSKGITCADCHGGNSKTEDMDSAMSKANGFIGVPKSQERFKTCAKCHADEKVMKRYGSDLPTDQFEKLQSSVHSKSSSDSKGYIADCITCHSVHDIASVKSPASKVYPTKIPALCGSCHSNANFMKQYNPKMPVDQVA